MWDREGRGLGWRGYAVVYICRRCEMIPIAAVAVAIAIAFDY